MHIIKAVFYSSLSIIPIYLVVILLSGDINNQLLAIALWVAYFLAVIGAIFIGVPTHLILSKLNIKSSVIYTFIGFIIPAALVWISHPFGADGFFWILWQGSLMGGFGALCAYVFWFHALRGQKVNRLL